MVVFGKCGCIRAKEVLFGQKWLYSAKVVVFRQKICICEKVVVFKQKLLYSGNTGCTWAKSLNLDRSGYNRGRRLY